MSEADRTGTGEPAPGHQRQRADETHLDGVDDPAGVPNAVHGGRGNLPDVPAEDVPKPDPDKDQG